METGFLTYGYCKILLIMETLAILFLKDLKTSSGAFYEAILSLRSSQVVLQRTDVMATVDTYDSSNAKIVLWNSHLYLRLWRDDINHSSKSADYRIFKEIINLEPYLLPLNTKHWFTFINYRTD